MTHYDVSYKGLSREDADKKAIFDIIEYLGTDQRAILLFGDLVALATHIEQEVECESADGKPRKQTIQGLNMTLGFAGISGYPFHAFCRRYCLSKYREWMMGGSDPVPVDEQGFTIKE